MLYKEYYKLEHHPFSLTTAPEFLYWSQQHQNAYRHLLHGIQNQQSLTLLAGEVGTGKTTILHALMEFLRSQKQTRIIYLANSKIDAEALLYYTLSRLDLQVEKGKKIDHFLTLERFLHQNLGNGERVLLILDESQNYPYEVLEEIRLLSNIERSKEKLIQIILAGQPQLLKNISDPNMYQLKQRIGVIYNLLPLNQPETGAYIQKRLEVAGAKGRPLFHEKAIDGIYHHSTGIPRVINLICDHALLYGYAMEKSQVTQNIVQQVAEDMGLTETSAPTRGFLYKNYHKKEQKPADDTYDDAILEYAKNYMDGSADEGPISHGSRDYKSGYYEGFYKEKGGKNILVKVLVALLIFILGGFVYSKFPLLWSVVNLHESRHSSNGSAAHTNSTVHQSQKTVVEAAPETLNVRTDERSLRNQHKDNRNELSQ